MNLFALALGGFAGAVCRYWSGLLLNRMQKASPIPYAMLIVNLIGSFGLGLFTGGYVTDLESPYEHSLYLAVGVGFFGSFTTFSTFSNEAMQLWKRKSYAGCISYVLLTIAGSILLFAIGYGVGKG